MKILLLLLLEVQMVVYFVLVALRPGGAARVGLGRVWKWAGRFAARRRLAVAAVGLAAFLLNAGVTLVAGVPEPLCTDEYAYLLGGDTFAHGRLTNPGPPLVEPFQAPRVLVRPTYQSMYPPAQSLSLVVGFWVGYPIIGVWFGMACAAAATCWMLQAWVPPRWALLGGMIVVLNPYLVVTWGQSYWGGAVATAGGALVFGALRRLVRVPRVLDAVLMGVGLAVLANSRPYEGLVACAPAAVVMLVKLFGRGGPPFGVTLLKVILPLALTLGLAAALMGCYNAAVTGSPLTLPYQLAHRNGAVDAPLAATVAAVQTTHADVGREVGQAALKLFRMWRVFFGVALTPALFALPWALRDRWTRFAALCCGLVAVAILIQFTYGYPHYAAPVLPLLYLLVVQGLRRLRHCRRVGGVTGARLVTGVAIALVLYSATGLGLGLSWYPKDRYPPRTPYLDRLEQTEGRHLVFVYYAPKQLTSTDWVYNEPDVPAAKVVWARELGPEWDRKVIEAFPGRKVWRLDASTQPANLEPFPPAPK